INWWYNINNTKEVRGRSGYEPFEEDGNNVYCIAQFYPRMCMYNDVYGWQNKQFLGRGEFTLSFGDFKVEITVPDDHLVASTGTLINEDKVLSKSQKSRLKDAMKSKLHPVTIATIEEAEERMKEKSKGKKTWVFNADNVRDFAFASSRRFIWDALGVKMDDGRTVIAQSMWTKEGNCLWSKYSTKAVAHTIKWFSHYTFDYPYPTAWSIDGNMGMEYPMICFNYGRCEDDNTYSQRMKYGHIGVIIHEVGHNWFPMIVNSDERQWTWMDEGLTTFVQFLTEQQWEREYPSRRGPANKIVDYMKGDKEKISPIMTNSESIFQFGNNAYGKPATALNILRETIMGRELFDYAFKEYANRWKFKHPTPADFFRTMEDASAVDLDWFWRSWFYTNDHVDMAISDVAYYKVDTKNPIEESKRKMKKRNAERENISTIRNRKEIQQTQNEIDPTINDFYTNYDPLTTDIIDEEAYTNYLNKLSKEEKELLKESNNYYQITIDKLGGIAMPVILEFEYIDGTKEIKRIPAEIWRFDNKQITKSFVTQKQISSITLDPFLETADIDISNNSFPPQLEDDRFELFKRRRTAQRGRSNGGENPMQRAKRAEEKEKEAKNRINKP
ncbi:MAG: M1 family peptidase, partial [Saprospiraceae bacterium]|nr:M1 family peptidase [Saprospiraceae bacterium]